MRLIGAMALCAMVLVGGVSAQDVVKRTPIVEGKQALALKEFARAKTIFAAYVRAHPEDVQGQIGLADAELGLHEYAAAEMLYRRVVSAQPLLWQAHKNLVIVEAALGRWEDFDGERMVLRAARERDAVGISRHESDVIDVITTRGQRWIVRDYFEPMGRSGARYNFERFSNDGRVLAYVSLESANAFREVLKDSPVVIGVAPQRVEKDGFALNWYDGKAHGTIAKYAIEPKYEVIRRDFLRNLRDKKRD